MDNATSQATAMSLRDYFAAQAMTSLVRATMSSDGFGQATTVIAERRGVSTAQLVAEMAYQQADAMLEASASKSQVRQALETAHEYLETILEPCEVDCECVLHVVEEALGLPTTKGSAATR